MQSIDEIRGIHDLQEDNIDNIIKSTKSYITEYNYGVGSDCHKKQYLLRAMVLQSERCGIIENICRELFPSYGEDSKEYMSEIAYYKGRECGCSGIYYCDYCIIPGGSEGQVLVKNSGEDGDYSWRYINGGGGELQDLNEVNLQGNLTTLGMIGTEYFENKGELEFSQMSDITVRAGEMEW